MDINSQGLNSFNHEKVYEMQSKNTTSNNAGGTINQGAFQQSNFADESPRLDISMRNKKAPPVLDSEDRKDIQSTGMFSFSKWNLRQKFTQK